ncbi:Prolyl 4-hydroxylase subunit alpha-2 [Thelohanellus kitauei]|uniref:Prolyl 4-hydroxylase subunit alpha-2 n=1 Tax=Thelohanellus kitauei TaxID=669202 RepID=A0A0C2N8Q2_THEKT|nr:Prolyl 4-hydroxylase subunit alpha-2 [Thelohanellus kitauei]
MEELLSKITCKEGKIWNIDSKKLADNLCYVKKGDNTFGKFITSNVEQILTDPKIFLLRQIASEEDILYLKKQARNKLKTSTISNYYTGKLETADYRITQSFWMQDESDPVCRKIKAKITVATGLTLGSSEYLQLANYGIGGYYDTHFDYGTKKDANKADELTMTDGDRVATFLLYMSDVPIGGKTVFHRLGLAVHPSKRDALFWYNLFPDETGDARMRHIACPIALGTKWVGTFWIRARGEERSVPCDIKQMKWNLDVQ